MSTPPAAPSPALALYTRSREGAALVTPAGEKLASLPSAEVYAFSADGSRLALAEAAQISVFSGCVCRVFDAQIFACA
jgi:hypothetical protein